MARARGILTLREVYPVRSLICYLGCVFFPGALAAPWIYWMTHWVAALFPALQGLAQAPFSRYVNRSLLVAAVLGLGLLLPRLGVNSWSAVGLILTPEVYGPLRKLTTDRLAVCERIFCAP